MIGADLAVLFCWVMDGSSNRVEASTDLEVSSVLFQHITLYAPNADTINLSIHHKNTIFPQNFIHFTEQTLKSTSAHPLQKPAKQSSLYHLPFLLLPPFNTADPSPLLPHHQLHLLIQTTTAYISFHSPPAS